MSYNIGPWLCVHTRTNKSSTKLIKLIKCCHKSDSDSLGRNHLIYIVTLPEEPRKAHCFSNACVFAVEYGVNVF
jgi:hypothetical protein